VVAELDAHADPHPERYPNQHTGGQSHRAPYPQTMHPIWSLRAQSPAHRSPGPVLVRISHEMEPPLHPAPLAEPSTRVGSLPAPNAISRSAEVKRPQNSIDIRLDIHRNLGLGIVCLAPVVDPHQDREIGPFIQPID